MEHRTGLIKFFALKGRVNRVQYLIATISLIVLIAVGISFWVAVWDHFESPYYIAAARFAAVLFVAIFIVGLISITVRRFQDIGKRWFYVPLLLVPLYNIYLLVILYFRAGEKRTNEFGPPII
ncbi:MAG: hypothetical protein C0609_08215 [Deltaproteobacteria bacterium]|nr:MAG: hypothetical protein C0609_08215 [Deltaproteobacteria bacterium]